jgi:hypothetical protein
LFVGLRNNKDILEAIQVMFLRYYKHFEIHHLGILGHSLNCMNACTDDFSAKLDELFSQNKKQDITEMLTFQILLIILKNDNFSLNNIKKYFTIYTHFFENNEVQQKQAKTLSKYFRIKLDRIEKSGTKFENKQSLQDYLNESVNEIDLYLNKITI